MTQRILSAVAAVGLLATPATAQSVWDDPISFARLASNACLTGAMMTDEQERIDFIAQQYALDAPSDDTGIDLTNNEGINVLWEDPDMTGIFCTVTAPSGQYDADGVAAILDWLNMTNDTEVIEIDTGLYGPIARTLLDGRSVGLTVIDDGFDQIAVVGVFE